jgi:hypothetical protein
MKSNFNVVLILCVLSIIGCKSEYEKTVYSEIRSGEINNKLFLGLELGQSNEEYFEQCFKLNADKKINQANRGGYAEYIMHNTLKNDPNKIIMSFKPFFNNKILTSIDLRFRYTTWAPWNRETQSEVLIEKIKDTLMNWYSGNKFFKLNVSDNKNTEALIKIDGNRQMLMYKLGAQDVKVLIENLNSKKQI